MKILLSFILYFSSLNVMATGYFDWQKNIDTSCKATLTGRASNLFSKKGFWFDAAVSMDMWAQFMSIERPEDDCRIANSSPKDRVALMQCLAYVQDKWDWYRRCKPIVDQLSRDEGR
jgi:hypothetical protein